MIQSNRDTKETLIIDFTDLLEKHPQVSDIIVSKDGEKVAHIVEVEDRQFTVFVNGEPWQNTFERICFPQFLSDGSFICLCLSNYEWNLVIDGDRQEPSFDYAWNLVQSKDGNSFAFNVKRENSYGLCVNGTLWDEFFFDARDIVFSQDGKRVATYVRTKNPPLLDIFSFREGVWTLAVDGKVWDKNFISIFGATFSLNSKSVAATVRLGQQQYTVSVDGKPWDKSFINAWEPIFIGNSSVCLPAKEERGWTLFVDGKKAWKRNYVQLWNLSVCPSHSKIAATAATEFGKWTVIVDDIPWKRTFSQAVLAPIFSPDGARVAAVVRERDRWTVAVDGIPWESDFERISNLQFSPDGRHLVAKAYQNGKYLVVIDGKLGKESFDRLWEPSFCANGEGIIMRAVQNGKYIRKTLKFSEILG